MQVVDEDLALVGFHNLRYQIAELILDNFVSRPLRGTRGADRGPVALLQPARSNIWRIAHQLGRRILPGAHADLDVWLRLSALSQHLPDRGRATDTVSIVVTTRLRMEDKLLARLASHAVLRPMLMHLPDRSVVERPLDWVKLLVHVISVAVVVIISYRCV